MLKNIILALCLTLASWSYTQSQNSPAAPPAAAPADAAANPAPSAAAPDAAPKPADSKTPVSPPVATSPAPVSPELNSLLDKVEQRGATLKSYQADMLFKQEQLLYDVVKIRHGNLLYQVDNDRVRFRIHFADLQTQDLEDPATAPVVAFDEDYAFDGLWFTIRNARLKNIQRQEVCKTPAKKEEFRLGRGPFPLPFSIQKADVLKEFDVTLISADSPDPKTPDAKSPDPKPTPDPKAPGFMPVVSSPADSAHLMLKPKKDSAFAEQYVQLEMWIAKSTFVPMQMRFEKENREITTIVWSNIILDQPIDMKKFEPGPAGPDWTTEETPLPPENPPSSEPAPKP
jgi:hypothetical protein